MNVKLIFCMGLLLLATPVFSTGVEPYAWENNRKPYVLSPADKSKTELILKNHSQYEYFLENDNFIMYVTVHRIIRVNNNEAIQKNNRIVIPMGNTIELTELKARSISKDGKTVLFDKNNLKELKEEESGKAYRIFAIEGVETESEIEYFYTRKMGGRIFDRVYVQFDAPVKEGSFMLSCPKHLKFDFKAYHKCPEVKAEEKEERNIYTFAIKDVAPTREQPYSFLDTNRKKIEFKLAYNVARSQARLYTWEDAAKTFNNILSNLSKDEVKAVDKFIKSLGDNATSSVAERIKNIEHKIKTTVQVNEDSGDPALSKLESVVKYKVASHDGMTKLFLAVFNKLGIVAQPVITCSREESRFDPDFDTWAYLDHYLLYFPATKGYLAPYFIETSYPLVPAEYTAQKGLLVESVQVGEVKSALGTIQEIPSSGFELSVDDLNIDVNFTADFSETQVHQVREFGGYNASFFNRYYDMMPNDKRTALVEDLTKQTAPDAKIKTWKAQTLLNKGAGNFLLDVDFQSAHFIEKAGPRVLFKAGVLIGPQVEMYRDNERSLDVENDFNRAYNRVIRINFPAGYTVKNADDLKFNVAFQDKDRVPFLFKSDYQWKGNVMEITITEFYKDIFVPLARYEDFRKVINAAADFNKVVLVLEKKK